MELIDLTELQQVLQDLANDIRDNYKEHLEFNDRYTELGVPTGYTQKLIDSVKTQVVVGDQAYEVTMTLNDYWKYVEDDTKPHFPPVSKILEWVEIKPVIPQDHWQVTKSPHPNNLHSSLAGQSLNMAQRAVMICSRSRMVSFLSTGTRLLLPLGETWRTTSERLW